MGSTLGPEDFANFACFFYFALRNDQNCNSVFVITHQAQFELQGFSKSDFVHVEGIPGRDEYDAQEVLYSALVCRLIDKNEG